MGFLRGDDENYAANQDALEENIEVEKTWTSIDYGILAVKFVIWLVGQIIFVKLDFGAVYFATSAFAFIWLSLGKERRQPEQMSAYSVFNPNCQRFICTEVTSYKIHILAPDGFSSVFPQIRS